MKPYLKVVLEERERMTPKEGFNVCVFDDFGRPGEMLELIAHTDTKEDAERIKQSIKGAIVYIYSAD